MPSPQSKRWCFTINNYDELTESEIQLRWLSTPGGSRSLSRVPRIRYLVYGREVGESGTRHLQGFVIFFTNQRLTACKHLHATAHWEIARGTSEQASEYCKKDGSVYEWGELPQTRQQQGQAEKDRWDLAKRLAMENKIEEVESDIFVRYYGNLRAISKDYPGSKEDLRQPCGVWIFGHSGVGKSLLCSQQLPGCYRKNLNKWWDGYRGQDHVVMDDIDLNHKCLGSHIKIWLDAYAFVAEIKGGAIYIRPKLFVITSQYRIEEVFEEERMVEAIKRRCKFIELTRENRCLIKLVE